MSQSNITKLRALLKQQKISAYIIPTSDPHKSEYITDYWKIREWITGFTGSAGTAVVTSNHAGLWTDSRYFTQAENQLRHPFTLHKLITRQPEYIDWLADELNIDDTVGIDGQLFSSAEIEHIKNTLGKKKIKVIVTNDIFEKLWINRPPLPNCPIKIHENKFNSLNRDEKIEKIKLHIKNNNTEQLLVSALDDIAWLLNLRGCDIKYNPVFRAYVLINKKETTLFTDEQKISSEISSVLKADKIFIEPYNTIDSHLKNLSGYKSIEIDSNTFNHKLSELIPKTCEIIGKSSTVGKLKAIKTNNEIEQYKKAQIRDGVAMCEFLFWLEQHIKTDTITEIDAAKKSEYYRSKQDNYRGLSFETISAYNKNAALPHYSPNIENPVELKPKGMYLIDSGAQYSDGTTDITRTVALGKTNKEQITDFTLVLKGHIRLASTKFPKGTKGFHLDTLARLYLWQNGKDYGHGTGHGIGYYLNVHEGPQGFSQSEKGPANTVIESGMLITNEPGVYIEGKYGIRTENVLVCINKPLNDFLEFETITYCPIDKKLIDTSLLNEDEKNWLNSYHKTVYKLISPKAPKTILEWLKEKTSPIK